MSEGTADKNKAKSRSVSLPGRTKSEPAAQLPRGTFTGATTPRPAHETHPKRTDMTEASEARVHGRGGQLEATQRAPTKRASGARAKRKQRCMLAERLTFEESWHRRCDARPARPMINSAASRAWRHAVGAQLVRGVRQRRTR